MKPGKTVQRSSKSALITEGLISSRVDKSQLSLLMFFLAQGTLTNHWPPSNPLWKEVRITARWFKGIASSIAPRLLNFIEKPNTSSHCQICLAEIYMSRSWVWLRVKGNSKSVSTKTVKYQELAGSGVRSILPLLCTHTKNKALPFGVSLCGKHDAYAKKVVLLKRSHTDQFSSKTWAGHGCDLRKHFLCSSRSTHRGWAPAGCPGHGEGGCCGGGFPWHCWHGAAEHPGSSNSPQQDSPDTGRQHHGSTLSPGAHFSFSPQYCYVWCANQGFPKNYLLEALRLCLWNQE